MARYSLGNAFPPRPKAAAARAIHCPSFLMTQWGVIASLWRAARHRSMPHCLHCSVTIESRWPSPPPPPRCRSCLGAIRSPDAAQSLIVQDRRNVAPAATDGIAGVRRTLLASGK